MCVLGYDIIMRRARKRRKQDIAKEERALYKPAPAEGNPLLSLIGLAEHGSFADDIDEELCGRVDRDRDE